MSKKSEYNKKYYKEHREKALRYGAMWRKDNQEKVKSYYLSNKENVSARHAERKDEIAEYMKVWRDKNSDRVFSYNKTYRANNKERIAERQRIYNAEHKDKIAANREVYRAEHKEEAAAWCKNNSDKLASRAAKRRALKKSVTIGSLDEIEEIYKRAKEEPGIICYLCGKEIELGDRHVDHVTPLSRGGNHCAENLKITHSTCNMKKNSRLPSEIDLYEKENK